MYTVSEYTSTIVHFLSLWMDRLQEQVSKIEMYKRSMNNNYRKIHLICLFLPMKNKTSHSVWSCCGPFLHPCNECTLYFCLYTLEETLVLYGTGLKGAFSDVKGDLREIGDKLWVIY